MKTSIIRGIITCIVITSILYSCKGIFGDGGVESSVWFKTTNLNFKKNGGEKSIKIEYRDSYRWFYHNCYNSLGEVEPMEVDTIENIVSVYNDWIKFSFKVNNKNDVDRIDVKVNQNETGQSRFIKFQIESLVLSPTLSVYQE